MTMEDTWERHLQGWPLARFFINILDLARGGWLFPFSRM